MVEKLVGLFPVEDPHVKEMIEHIIIKMHTVEHPKFLRRPHSERLQSIVVV